MKTKMQDVRLVTDINSTISGSLLARHMRVQHVFASCGDCGQSRVKEDARARDGRWTRTNGRRRGTNRATKLRHVEWEMDAAAVEARARAMEGGEGESKRPLEAMRYGSRRRRKYRRAGRAHLHCQSVDITYHPCTEILFDPGTGRVYNGGIPCLSVL